MKQYSLIVALGIIFSCTKPESLPKIDQTGRRIFYNDKEYTKSKKDNEQVIIIDTTCIAQKQKALNDIKANKLTYYYNFGPHEQEFKAALMKYGISAKRGLSPTCIIDGRFDFECYEREMDEEVKRRYGNKFFDSIWNKTLLEHMKKFPNDSIVEGGKVLRWKEAYKSILK